MRIYIQYEHVQNYAPAFAVSKIGRILFSQMISNFYFPMRTSHLLLTFMLCWLSSLAFAQIDTEASLQTINQKRQKINRIGMLTLGSWAIGNIATAGFSISNAEGSRKSFHQMNLGWGAVNLAIAGFGYYSVLTEPRLLSLHETVDKHYHRDILNF
ncbi:MAG: hypothetical protein AAF734_08075 [Bacteroidota bacterium]